jgi:hypothetical protein
MTAHTFSRYLEFVRELVPDRSKRIHLLLDIYPVHIQQAAKEHTLSLNVQSHFIPAGLTDQYQPLDRRIFDRLKATARGRFMRHARAEQGRRIQKQEAVKSLVHRWAQVSESTVQSAWSIYGGTQEEDE